MKYKLFLSDYDGTLGVAPENDIDEQTANAIKEYQKRGGKFVICTGRAYGSLLDIVDKKGINCLLAGFQGAFIRQAHAPDYLFYGGIEKDLAKKIIKVLLKEKFQVVAYQNDVMYYQGDGSLVDKYMIFINSSGVKKVDDLEKAIVGTVSKMVVLCPEELSDQTVEKVRSMVADDTISVNAAVKGCVEIINNRLDKANAVRIIAEYYNIPYDQIITVGDSDNDIGLVGGGAWHGVAVGDAREELKAVAKEVTVPFKEKAVKYLLEKYCLND